MNLRSILEKTEALLTGHFRLSSGLHSSGYVQCARLLADPTTARELGAELGTRLSAHEIDLIVAPAIGGLVIGFTTAQAMDVPMIFTERKDGVMALRRGFRIDQSARVAIVEDVVTTGKSTKEAATVVETNGGNVVAIGSILNRSGETNPFDLPYEALETLEIETWSPEECSLCERGIEIDSPGSRFQKQKA